MSNFFKLTDLQWSRVKRIRRQHRKSVFLPNELLILKRSLERGKPLSPKVIIPYKNASQRIANNLSGLAVQAFSCLESINLANKKIAREFGIQDIILDNNRANKMVSALFELKVLELFIERLGIKPELAKSILETHRERLFKPNAPSRDSLVRPPPPSPINPYGNTARPSRGTLPPEKPLSSKPFTDMLKEVTR